MIKIADVKEVPKIYGVVDVSRSLGHPDPGALVSVHKSQKAAITASKSLKQSKVVQLVRDLPVGHHPNPQSEILYDRNSSRWL